MTFQKERDLELAARIGQSLLKQNQELTARNEMLDEQLDVAKEEVKRYLVIHTCTLSEQNIWSLPCRSVLSWRDRDLFL